MWLLMVETVSWYSACKCVASVVFAFLWAHKCPNVVTFVSAIKISLKIINFSQTTWCHGSLKLESFRSEDESEDEYENEFKGGCHQGSLFGWMWCLLMSCWFLLGWVIRLVSLPARWFWYGPTRFLNLGRIWDRPEMCPPTPLPASD